MNDYPATTTEAPKRFVVSRTSEAYADVLKTMLENWREEASALSGSALDDPLFLTTPAELLQALESFSAVATKVREGSDIALRKAMAAIRRPPRTVQYRGDLVSLLTRLARFASDHSVVQVRSPAGDWRRWPLSAEHVADIFPCAVGDITRLPSDRTWSASIQLAAPASALISLIAVKGSTAGDRLGMIGRQRQAEDVLHLVDRCIAASRARLTPKQAIESSVSAEAHRRRVGLLISDPRPEPRWRHDEAVDFSHLAVVQEIPGVGDAQSKIEIPWASVLSRHGAPHLVRELLGRMMGQRIHKALQFRRPRPPAEIRLRHSTIIHRGWIEAALRTTGDGDALRTVPRRGAVCAPHRPQQQFRFERAIRDLSRGPAGRVRPD